MLESKNYDKYLYRAKEAANARSSYLSLAVG